MLKAIIFFLPSFINFGIALYVFFSLPKRSSNDFFILFLILLAFWQLFDGLTRLSPTEETALQWSRVAKVPALLIIPTWFLFIITITGWKRKVSGILIFSFFIAPALFFLSITAAGLDQYFVLHSHLFGWVVNPGNEISKILYLWVALSALLMAGQLWFIFFREKKNPRMRRQILPLAAGYSIPIGAGVIFEIFFPVFFSIDNVPVTAPLFTLFSLSIIFSIRKYWLDFSPLYQWETIIETMNEGIMIVDNSDEIMYVNKKFCAITGYSAGELVGKTANDVFIQEKEKKEIILKKIEDRKRKISDQYQVQIKKKTNEKIWMLINGAPYFDSRGKVIGSIGIHTDITWQKKAESSLKQSETKFHTLFESTRDAVMLLDETRFLDCNPATLKIFGCSTKAEFCSKHPANLSPPFQPCGTDSMTLVNQRIETALKSGTTSFEWMHRRADTGIDFPAEVLLSRIKLEGKWVLQATVRDITNRKRKEERFLSSLKEISDYKYALDQSSIVSITDEEGIIKYANEKFCKISKYSTEELIGQNHRIINSGYHPREFFNVLWSTILSGNVWRGDVKSKAKDGTFFWSDTIIVPFIDTTGKPYQFVAIRNDITKRKLAEEALAESYQFSKQIIQGAQDGIIVYDKEMKFKEWNHFMETFTGILKPDVLGKYANDVFPFLEESGVIENIKKALAGEIITAKDFYFQIPGTGKAGWALDTNAPLRNLKGEISGVIGTVRDITARKLTEEALQKSESNLRAIFENTNTGFLLLDTSFNIINFNQRAFEISFLALGKEIGYNINLVDLLPPERQKKFFERQSKVLSGETIKYETHYSIEDEDLWLEVNTRPVTGKSSCITGISFAINDITERKKTETKLLESIKEIDTFIFRSSHDLKGPVCSLKGLIQLMKKELAEPKGLEYVGMIEKTNKRMEEIVNDLSSVVLIKDEKRKPNKIRLIRLVESTISIYNNTPAFDKIRFTIMIEKDLWIVSDYTLVSAICQNLIGNAIKYRKKDEGHKITIEAKKQRKRLILVVSDNGEGISVKPLEKIFEMFYRGNLRSTGTGLGLYIVKKALEKLNGTIKVESEPGTGSIFTLCIPESSEKNVSCP